MHRSITVEEVEGAIWR